MKREGLQQFVEGNANTFLYGGAKTTNAIKINLRFGENGYHFDLAPTQDGKFWIDNEQLHYFPPAPHRNTTRTLGSGNFNPELFNDKERSGLDTDRNAPWHIYQSISSWQIYHFHDSSALSRMRPYRDKGHNEVLFNDAANIAPFLLSLKSEHRSIYRDISSAVRCAIPSFNDFELKPNADENLRLDWLQTGLNDFTMRPGHLSDGSIRFICLATALLQPNLPATIVIDEPELGLHPRAIAVLAELLQAVATQTQVIVATQSPELINYFALEDIILVNRSNGQSTFKRLNEKDYSAWLEEYSVGELWTKNVIPS